MGRKKKSPQNSNGSGIENALAPVASLAVLTGAVVHSVLDRRQTGNTVPLGYQPPSSDQAATHARPGADDSRTIPAEDRSTSATERNTTAASTGADARAGAATPTDAMGSPRARPPYSQPAGDTDSGDSASSSTDYSGTAREFCTHGGDDSTEDRSGSGDGEKSSRLRGRLDAIGRRVPLLGKALAVQQRYSELRGNNLASAVTFQAFVSLFPLLLVIVAVIGFVSAHASGDIAGSVVGELGLTGEAARAVRDAVAAAEESRRAASIVGLAGLLWSGLGLVNALQYAYNQVWQVEERGLKDKAVGIGWLMGAVLILVGASAVTTVLRWLPDVLAPLAILAALVVNFALWLWTAKVLPNRDVGWRALIPGAILGAVGLEILKVAGAYYVPRAVASSSQLYGSLGVVFAVLAWLLFFGRLLVYSAVVNVVLYEGRRGTVRTVIEVPAAPGTRPDETTRSGRVQKEDVRT